MRHYQGQERGRLFPGKAPACARDYADNIKISKNGSMNKVFLVLRVRERERLREIYYEKLVHLITEAEKSQDLYLAN